MALTILRRVRNVYYEMMKFFLTLTILFSRFLIFFSANWMACPIGVSISEGGDGVSLASTDLSLASTAAGCCCCFSLEADLAAAAASGFPEASLLASEVVMMVSEGMTLVSRSGEGMQQRNLRNLISANKNASDGLVGKQQNDKRRVEEGDGRRRRRGCLLHKKNQIMRKNGGTCFEVFSILFLILIKFSMILFADKLMYTKRFA